MSAKTKRNLCEMWEGVDYLFIGKVSMLGCDMLYNVSRALTKARGSTTTFGGINVILASDFAQFPPIGDTRLYKNMSVNSIAASATNRAQGKLSGCLLWTSFETVVILHESMRQSGNENVQFVDLLHCLRDGVCTEADFELLRTRLLQWHGMDVLDSGWNFAPIIATNNATRDAINQRAAKSFAEQTGQRLEWYHAIDTHKRSLVTDLELVKELEEQHSGQTKHRLRCIPLVLGMPVSINQNFDVAVGVVNGSYGTLNKIRYFR